MEDWCFVELGILEQPGSPVPILTAKPLGSVLEGRAANLRSISSLT